MAVLNVWVLGLARKTIVKHLVRKLAREHRGDKKASRWDNHEYYVLMNKRQCEHYADGGRRCRGRRREGVVLNEDWDPQMKWGNEMKMEIVRKYIGDAIFVQLQCLKNIFCCEKN